MGPFGRKPEQDDNHNGMVATVPEARTLIVTEMDAEGKWIQQSYLGHGFQVTDAGALIILRAIDLGNGQATQQLVQIFGPGEWKRAHEDIDITKTSPLSIH